MVNTMRASILALALTAAPVSALMAAGEGGAGVGATETPLPGARLSAPGSVGPSSIVTPGAAGGTGTQTTTGNAAGTGTGFGIGSTSRGQPSTQSPVGVPTSPSTTPGGPPTADTSNMSGTGTGAGR
jgi:hypothetical protein